MHVAYQSDSKGVEAQADLFASMADRDRRMRSHALTDARTQMDAIDREAHEAIQKIIDSKGGWFGAWAMMSMIWAILAQARTAAVAVSAAAVGEHWIAGTRKSKRRQNAVDRAERQVRQCRPSRTVPRRAGALLHGGQRDVPTGASPASGARSGADVGQGPQNARRSRIDVDSASAADEPTPGVLPKIARSLGAAPYRRGHAVGRSEVGGLPASLRPLCSSPAAAARWFRR